MDASDQVIFLLKVVINIAPVAVYFLVLGQVNSQARPVVVNARADFQILTLSFVPLLVWPIPFLVEIGQWWVLIAGLAVMSAGFAQLVPATHSGWVLYNMGRTEGWDVLRQAVAARGWASRRTDRGLEIPAAGFCVEVTPFALLRNVTFRVTSLGAPVEPDRVAELEAHLRSQVARQSLLPSMIGGCLMALGVSLMIVPLWLMSRHVDAIVEVVHRLLFA